MSGAPEGRGAGGGGDAPVAAGAVLRAEPLTPEAFAPFGRVLHADPATAVEINSGHTTRFHALALAETDARVGISIFRGRPRPLEAGMLERHPHGSQAFMPLGGRDWLAVVAPGPEAAAMRLFRVPGDTGLQYAAGVWHHPLLVLGAAQDFLVVDRDGEGGNLEEVFFPPRPLEA